MSIFPPATWGPGAAPAAPVVPQPGIPPARINAFLAAPVALDVAGAATPIVTIGPLVPGVYVLLTTVTIANGNAAAGVAALELKNGTGAYTTLGGAANVQSDLPAGVGGARCLSMFTVLLVTAFGTLNLDGVAPGAAASSAVAALPADGARFQASGFSIVYVSAS